MAVTTCDVDPALMDGLCRAIIESVEEYYKAPEHVAEFEQWRRSEEGRTFLASVSGAYVDQREEEVYVHTRRRVRRG